MFLSSLVFLLGVCRRCVWLAMLGVLACPSWAQAVGADAGTGAVAVSAQQPLVNLRTHWQQAVLPASHGLSPDALLALPASQFSPGNSRSVPNLSAQQVLLLRTRVSFETVDKSQPQLWALEIPMARVDDVQVHHRFAGGAWRSARMGDRVPFKNWPFASNYPMLKFAQEGAQLDVLLEVRHAGRFTTPVWLQTDGVAHADQLKRNLYNGLVVGFMLASALLGLMAWRAFGNTAFVWVALQMTLFALGETAYHGHGDFLLWGDASPWWRDQSKFLSTMLILAVLIPTFAASAGLHFSERGLWLMCLAAGVLTAMVGFALPALLPAQLRVGAAMLLVLFVLGMAAWLCKRAFAQGERIAPWLLAAWILYTSCILLTAVDNSAYIEGLRAAHIAPLGYALGTVSLMYGLYASHRFGNTAAVHAGSAKALTDASTGLPNRAGFANELARHVLDLRQRRKSGAVLWLRLDGAEHLAQALGREAFEDTTVRLAAALADCLVGGETLARLADDTFVMVASEHNDSKSADQLATQVLARALAAFEPQHKVQCRVVWLPIPSGQSSPERITHVCERALARAPVGKRIIKLLPNGQPAPTTGV